MAPTAHSRAEGYTPSEKQLAGLADRTFLDLWSWPNVFKEPGKEICDLLVVCGNDVLIFSDKSIAWPAGDMEVAWPRWYRRAISKSVEQVGGAARWLQDNPERVFADAKCQHRVPLDLPPKSQWRVHGICVVSGAEKAASDYFNDADGTLMICSHLKGNDHTDFSKRGHTPFAVGDVNPKGPFVHVFNLATLELVMAELDTISDFTEYLNGREALVRSNEFGHSPSEAELLANWLLTEKNESHAFPTAADVGAELGTRLTFTQGEYAYLVRSDEYRRRYEASPTSLSFMKG